MLSRGNRVVALAVLGALWSGCAPKTGPNVLLVVVDTLRADHLSHYGYHRPTASALDEFAASATLFTDCTAPAPWTVPSVASIMTGLHPVRHRLQHLGFALPEDLVTMPEVFRDDGWSTFAISFNPVVRPAFGFGQGFERFEDHHGKFSNYPNAGKMVKGVRTWLHEGPSQSFFLYLQPMNVHGPYKVPEKAESTLLGRAPSREFEYFQEPMRSIMRHGQVELRDQVDAAYVESLVDQYDTAVRYTTDQLARIFALLKGRGLYDDTLIIVTADHGEELFDHGGFNHGTSMYEELLHVPLYVKTPGQHEGSRITSPVSLLDIFPTIIDVAGLSPQPGLDGRSLRPVLDNQAMARGFDDRDFVHQAAWKNHFVGFAISSGHFKLVEIGSNYERIESGLRLYDLNEDPGEEVDVSEAEVEVLKNLRQEMTRALSRFKEHAGSQPENRRHLLDSDRERLKVLGYVE